MSSSSGPNIYDNGIIFSADVKNRKSNIFVTSVNKILREPWQWTAGSGSFTDYSQNGDTVENERVLVTDDPWGGKSVVWESRPSGNGNADGGWNSSYFAIDSNYLYRHSVWVRRTTSSAGGTFYLGTNPSPIRNDTQTLQSNPYWECEGTSALTQNVWYLVTTHTYPESWSGTSRHPDSGMWTRADGYSPGNPTRQVNGCNVGSADVKWAPGTTSVQHRTYHYYCGDSTTRLQFAYPRVDKCDGDEPSIAELLYTPPSFWGNIANIPTGSKQTGKPSYETLGGAECYRFTAGGQYFDDSITITRTPSEYLTMEAWIYPENEVVSGDRGTILRVHDANSAYFSWNKSTQQLSTYWYGHNPLGYHELGPAMARNQWHHVCAVWDGTTHYHYIDGVQYSTPVTGNAATGNLVEVGMESATRQFSGGISQVRVYDVALTKDQVLQNYQASKGRYGL